MALIAHTSAGGGAGGTSGAVDTTGATFLVAVGVADSGTPSITDSKGNTWTPLTQVGGSFPTYHQCRLYYVTNPTVGSGHTFTVAGTNASACFAAHDTIDTTSPFDAEAGAQNLGVSAATGGSVGAASRLVITGLGTEDGTISTPTISTSGFTVDELHPHVGGVSYGTFLGHKYVSASENPSWSLGGTFDVNVVNASFIVTGGGGGPVVPVFVYQYRRRR